MIPISLYILAYIAGGYDISRHALKAVLHARFDIDFLMLVAAIGAAILGEWAEARCCSFSSASGTRWSHKNGGGAPTRRFDVYAFDASGGAGCDDPDTPFDTTDMMVSFMGDTEKQFRIWIDPAGRRLPCPSTTLT